MLPNLPDLLPLGKENDVVDNLAALSISCNDAPAEPSFVGGFDPRLVSNGSVSAITDPFQSDIPSPDPFDHTHALLIQKGCDLEIMHDFLKKQCCLPPVRDQQKPTDDLLSQPCPTPYITTLSTFNSEVTSKDITAPGQPLSQLQSLKASSHSLAATSLSETKFDAVAGITSSSPFPKPSSITFPTTPPHPIKDTPQYDPNTKRKSPIAGIPPRSQCSTQPKPDRSGIQTLRPRRQSTGEIAFPNLVSDVSILIRQPTLAAGHEMPDKQYPTSGICHVETHASNGSISVHPQLLARAEKSPLPSRFPSESLMVTPDRPRASSTSSRTSPRSGGSVTCGAPTQANTPCKNSVRVSAAHFDGIQADDSFEGLCWRHDPSHPSYRGSSTSPSSKHTQKSGKSSPVSRNKATKQVKVPCFGTGQNSGKSCKSAAVPVLAIYYRQEQDKQDERYVQDTSIKQFCRAHRDIVLANQAVFPRSIKLSDPVLFDDYIPRYLHPATRAALRYMMEEPLSRSDRPGYIYCFHLQAQNNEDKHIDEETVFLKVGRAVNISKRIGDWAKQCPSKRQTLQGYWPFQTEGSADESDGSLLRGCLMPKDMGPFHHRVERFVHIELADLVMNRQYLQPEFPDINIATELGFPENSPHSPAGKQLLQRVVCSDCLQVHREIFPFTRIRSGKNINAEWDSIVKPVIQRWGDFVTKYRTV